MVWSGLGMNYGSGANDINVDGPYFKQIGLTYIRINIRNFVFPFVAATNAFYRGQAQSSFTQGFYTNWGLSSGTTLTTSNWPNYHDAIVAEAQYCQQQGITFQEFEIGNELEEQIDNTTITTTSLIPLLMQLATDVKAVWNQKVTYAVSGNFTAAWIAKGSNIGNIDYLSVHPYGQVYISGSYGFTKGNGQSIYPLYKTTFPPFYSVFGNQTYISETNIDVNTDNFNITPEMGINAMRSLYSYLKSTGVSRIYIYNWFNGGNTAVMKYTTLNYAPWWDVVLTDNKRKTFYP